MPLTVTWGEEEMLMYVQESGNSYLKGEVIVMTFRDQVPGIALLSNLQTLAIIPPHYNEALGSPSLRSDSLIRRVWEALCVTDTQKTFAVVINCVRSHLVTGRASLAISPV